MVENVQEALARRKIKENEKVHVKMQKSNEAIEKKRSSSGFDHYIW
jgi:hypothetical protein